MAALIDRQKILAVAGSDKELAYELRTYSGRVRFDLPDGAFDLVVEDGVPTKAEDVNENAAADVVYSAPAEFWATAFATAVPPVGHESATAGIPVDHCLDRVIVLIVQCLQAVACRVRPHQPATRTGAPLESRAGSGPRSR